jgi:hypothetical protein
MNYGKGFGRHQWLAQVHHEQTGTAMVGVIFFQPWGKPLFQIGGQVDLSLLRLMKSRRRSTTLKDE